MVRMPMITLAVIASVFLAGCSSGPATPPEVDNSAPVVITDYTYECPPGPTSTVYGVCVGRIAAQTDGYYETHVAIHPENPRVIAIGANGMHTIEESDASGRNIRERSLEFFFSEDGGASWRRSTFPYVSAPGANPLPIQAGWTEDPRLEFDAQGTLHVSALVSANGYNPGPSPGQNTDLAVVYARTSDLGRTWSSAELLAGDNNNQANHIGLDSGGRVFVSWESSQTSAEVAWSLDRGKTWVKGTPGLEVAGCAAPSNVVVTATGVPIFACGGVSDNRDVQGLRVYEIDVEAQALVLRGEIPEMPCLWPRMAIGSGGTVVVAADSCDYLELWASRSVDEGRTWINSTKLDPTPGERPWVGHLASDSLGIVHLFALPTGGSDGTTDRVHVALSPFDLSIVHQATLSRYRPPTSPPALDTLQVGEVHDHYWGGAFGPNTGIAAWSRDGGIDFTVVVPASPSNEGIEP